MIPYLYSTGAEPTFCQGRRFVRLVFQKTKSSIFLFVIGRTIYNNFDESSCNHTKGIETAAESAG